MLRNRHFYILLFQLLFCSLIYYLGELVVYAGLSTLHWPILDTVHDVALMLFLFPLCYAGYFFRIRGAIITSLAVLIVVLPRAVIISPYPDLMVGVIIFTVIAGGIGILIGILRNQNESCEMYQAIARSEKDRLLNILERMIDGVIIIGPDYKMRFMNQSMIKEFGENDGSYCYQYLYGRDYACGNACNLASVINGANKRWDQTFQDGRTFDVIATPFVDSDGKICQLTIFRNITQRKFYEREMFSTIRSKSEILSNVSHELKSPLTSIKGTISSLLIKDIEFNNETRDMLLQSIAEETDRLISLVNNLLNMSKLEAGVWEPNKKRIYVLDIVNDVVGSQKWAHPKHVITIKPDANVPEIYADYNQVKQVLINLLENAANYSAEGTKITIRIKNVKGGIEVSVSDEGIGINTEDLKKIFDKFYRGTHKSQNHWGVGLGLAICRSIIVNHRGQIWANSKPGHGSTFIFTLPVGHATTSEDKD